MKNLIFALFIFLAGSVAQASLIEARLGYGAASADPDSYNDAFGALSSNLEIKHYESFTLDGIVQLPLFPLGLGVRLERADTEEEGRFGAASLNNDLEFDRYALLVNWRPIDTTVFAGPIITIGTHKGEFKSTAQIGSLSGSTDRDLDPGGPSYSIGVEGGLKFGSFLAGLELGHQTLKFKEPANNTFKTDLSGPYARLMIGLGFL